MVMTEMTYSEVLSNDRRKAQESINSALQQHVPSSKKI